MKPPAASAAALPAPAEARERPLAREFRIALWLLAGAAAGYLLILLGSVLPPFIFGLAIAYFLDPTADRLQRWGCSRTVATLALMALFFAIVVGLIAIVVPFLEEQLVQFAKRLPDYAARLRARGEPLLQRLLAAMPPEMVERAKATAGSSLGEAAKWAGAFILGVWSGGMAVFQVLSLVVITPIVAFYLLRDWDLIVDRIDALLPPAYAPTLRELARSVDDVLSGFVRGQAAVCGVLAAYFGIALTAVGLEFGLLVGIITGLISFIPYIGGVVGVVLAVGIAYAQFPTWGPIGIVLGIFGVGHLLENYFLAPRLVGDRIGLHPVWVMFALLAGGALFGFTGVLLSVPVAGIAGVLIRFGLRRYQASSLYRHERAAGEPNP